MLFISGYRFIMVGASKVARRGLGLSASRSRAREARNEKAVKSLKITISRNRLISPSNELSDLRPGSRNRSFRLEKDSFRFRCFLASPQPGTQSGPGRSSEPRASKEAISALVRSATYGASGKVSNFFIFFACNPLKSSDSAKEIQAIFLGFIWICLGVARPEVVF
jgi:hypothetical protein